MARPTPQRSRIDPAALVQDDVVEDQDDVAEDATDLPHVDVLRFAERMQASWQGLEAFLDAHRQEVTVTVQRIDTLLSWIDRALKTYQPPKTGRIRIVWRLQRTRQPLPAAEGELWRQPVLVRWIRAGRTRWRYEVLRVPARSGAKRREFAEHAAQVKALIQLAARLIDWRQRIIHRVLIERRVLGQQRRSLATLEEQALDLLVDLRDTGEGLPGSKG